MAKHRRHSSERNEAFRILHEAGWRGPAIARVTKVSPETVRRWRIDAGVECLPSPYQNRIDEGEATLLYDQGESDCEIAVKVGVTQSAVTRWRQRRGFARNFDPLQPLDPVLARRARAMLADGASRKQVTEHLDIRALTTVQKLRRTMSKKGLRPTGLTSKAIRSQVLRDKSVLPRISKAVGRQLPPDVKHDAISSLYLAVLDGLLNRDLIEERAPRFRTKAFALNGHDYRQRSIDDDTSGWSLIERIEDPNGLDWLDALEREHQFAK